MCLITFSAVWGLCWNGEEWLRRDRGRGWVRVGWFGFEFERYFGRFCFIYERERGGGLWIPRGGSSHETSLIDRLFIWRTWSLIIFNPDKMSMETRSC